MKAFFSLVLGAAALVLVTAGFSFGQAATATWPLKGDSSVTVTGSLTAWPESKAGLDSSYGVPAAGTTNKVQKLRPNAATSGTSGTGSWPVETDLNIGRYVQFSVTPKTNFSVYVDSISMMIGSKAMVGMNASIFYSMKSDFSDSTKLVELDTVAVNAAASKTVPVKLVVNSGDTLYMRFYPWTKTSSTSDTSYLYLGNVVMSGYAINPSLSTTQLWDFQADSIGFATARKGWSSTDLAPVVAKDTITPSASNHVLQVTVKNYNAAPVLMTILPSGKTMADYNTFNFKGYFASGDVAYKVIYVQAFKKMPTGGFQYQADTLNNIGSYNRAVATGSTKWENINIPIKGSYSMTDTVYLAFGMNQSGTGSIGGAGSQTVWYVDSVKLGLSTTTASKLTKWGITPVRNAAGWKLTVSGDSSNSHGSGVKAWEAVRGEFNHPLVATAAANGAVIVSGKVTFIGEGPDVWSGLRYGVFNNLTPGTLTYAGTDSVRWVGFAENSYGYMFTPQSGTSYAGNIPSGTGASQGVTMGGSWISTYGGAVGFGGMIQQAPARANMAEGTYDWAISVHPQSNGTKLVNFYFIEEGTPTPYWYGGSLVDTTSQTRSDTLNGVCFGVEGGANMTGMILFNVVDSLGADITVPRAPWQDYYVSDWGFYGSRTGGWALTPGIIGNTTISADSTIPDQQWAAVRGGFVGKVMPINGVDSTLMITGSLDFTGGSFTRPQSFEFGIFNSSIDPGKLDSTKTNGYMWSGSEAGNSGYLFVPPSGNAGSANWIGATAQQGTMGGVVNRPWLSTNGDQNYVLSTRLQAPKNAVADTGMYSFAISVAPQADGSQIVSAILVNSDSSYMWGASATDRSSLATKSFNSINFALEGGTPTTSLAITNVHVTMGTPVNLPTVLTGVNGTPGNVPKEFSLSQNYPNPFNPSTTIRYDIPKTSQVSITIYDVLGRVVTTLVNGVQSPSSYVVQWNAQRYSSGVYFCRIEAHAQDGSSSFNSVKKLVFMK